MKLGTRVNFPHVLVSGLLFLLGASAAGADAPVDETYTLQPGDVLDVSVWQEQTLQGSVLVRPDGAFTFPLAGEIEAKGKTIAQVTEQIRKRLVKYIPEPVVTVSVKQNTGNMIYVLGRVRQPGQFVMPRALDVMQALTLAGGLTPFADGEEIRVFRRVDGVQQTIPFNYDEVELGQNLEQNITLKAGDLVMVP